VTTSGPLLEIEILDKPSGTKVFALSGPLTIQTLFDFQHLVRQEANKAIIVDLTNVAYMDSAGLGCVIGAFTSCERTNRGFAITGVGERIRTLFAVTHIEGLLPCFDSVQAAEAAVTNRAT
jgi:anti-anti-sigma factor